MPAHVTTSCPSNAVLREFNDGRIPDESKVDQISEHLGHCDKCIATLESLEPDPLALGLRKSLNGDSDTRQSNDINDSEDSARDDLSGSIQAFMKDATPSTASWRSSKPQTYAEQHCNILAFIGEGSFGKTFLGMSDSEELVAVKISNPKKLLSDIHRQQFLDDCETATALQHPHIHSLIDFGFWDEERMYYSTRYVESPSLTEIARKRGNLNFEQALSIFVQVIDAIEYAHSRKVLHRHLNPDNILLEKWEWGHQPTVLVTDFGFTYDSRYQFELLEPRPATSPFDSPESTTNDASFIDLRSDIYSLGKILKLLMRVAPPPDGPLCEMLAKIVDFSTSPRRRRRYATVKELTAALKQLPIH